jgi:hypothetical protein
MAKKTVETSKDIQKQEVEQVKSVQELTQEAVASACRFGLKLQTFTAVSKDGKSLQFIVVTGLNTLCNFSLVKANEQGGIKFVRTARIKSRKASEKKPLSDEDVQYNEYWSGLEKDTVKRDTTTLNKFIASCKGWDYLWAEVKAIEANSALSMMETYGLEF